MLLRMVWFLYRAGVLIVCLPLFVTNVRLYIPGAEKYGTAAIPDDIHAQLTFLGQALRAGTGEEMQNYFPEGYFFSHVWYGLAWVQVGLRADGNLHTEAIREARWALAQLESDAGREPFSPTLDPPHGVFYVGWKNWLRGGLLLLDSGDVEERQRFETDCAALAVAFEANNTPFLTAYPNQAWPVDSVVGVATLALHDHLLTARYEKLIARWLMMARERVDPVTGLLPHSADPKTGKGLEPARGSSQSMIVRFLLEIDPVWASEQYAAFRRQFLGFLGTVPGIREYPLGIEGEGDVDSGPLINGLSASATIVTMGAAFLYGDRELGEAFLHVGESAGIPIQWGGTKRYIFGLLSVSDAMLAWSQTAIPFVAKGMQTTIPNRVSSLWRLPLHGLSLAVVAVLVAPEWMRHRWRKRRTTASKAQT
jgi:hypothetical protein